MSEKFSGKWNLVKSWLDTFSIFVSLKVKWSVDIEMY